MPKLQIQFRIHSDGWGLIVLCVLIGIMIGGLALGPVVGLLLLISLLLHEAGHMLMATLLGVQVKEFGLSLTGAYTRRSYATNRLDEVLIALAGPLTSFCIAIPLLSLQGIGHQIGLCNAALGAINLFPIAASDGLHIIHTLRSPNAPGPRISAVPPPPRPGPTEPARQT